MFFHRTLGAIRLFVGLYRCVAIAKAILDDVRTYIPRPTLTLSHKAHSRDAVHMQKLTMHMLAQKAHAHAQCTGFALQVARRALARALCTYTQSHTHILVHGSSRAYIPDVHATSRLRGATRNALDFAVEANAHRVRDFLMEQGARPQGTYREQREAEGTWARRPSAHCRMGPRMTCVFMCARACVCMCPHCVHVSACVRVHVYAGACVFMCACACVCIRVV